MTRKLLMAAAVAVAIALTPSIGIGTAEADSGGFHGGGFHGGGFHGGGFHHRAFSGERRFRGTGLGYGFIGYTEPAPAAEAPSVFCCPAACVHCSGGRSPPVPRNDDRGRGHRARAIVLAQCSVNGEGDDLVG